MSPLLLIYGIVGISLVFSGLKSPEKTSRAFVIAGKAFKKTLPSLLSVIGVIGLTFGLLTPETISGLVGAEAGLKATLIAAVIGAITLIPSLVAFPLAASLLRAGATVMTISVFVTTLVMVGVMTAPMEMKLLGKPFTFLRNGLGLLAALMIAAIMGVVL